MQNFCSSTKNYQYPTLIKWLIIFIITNISVFPKNKQTAKSKIGKKMHPSIKPKRYKTYPIFLIQMNIWNNIANK